jgi:two-component system, OmpR family, sensor kinase
MSWWLPNMRDTPERMTEWSLSRRLKSRIIAISLLITVIVTASVTMHYGYDIPELQQRTVFGLAQDIAHEMPFEADGPELHESIDRRLDLFTRYPDAYEWYVLDGEGALIGSSVDGPVNRADFPPGLPPAEWDAPTRKGGWQAGKTFVKDGITRHIIAVSHSDPGGLLFGLAMGEALMHIVLPLVPFSFLITFFVSATVRRTLLPLQSLAEQAKRVQTMADIRPLDPKGAPQEVAELVKALNIALEKLRASIEAEKRFLQDAAHALRTPLAIVKARLELDGEKVDKNSMVEEVDGLIRLASQLLASANAERLVLHSDARAELADLARDVVSNMTPLAIRTGVDLGYSDNGVNATVRGDSDAISHALKNLIENALKYTPRGKAVTVHVEHNPPSISVTDEGPGIPEGAEEMIFSRHSRGKFGDGKGAGLGLSIVRRIMSAHGGAADFVRTEAPGATFRLTFQQAPAEASPPAAEPRTANDATPPASRAAA